MNGWLLRLSMLLPLGVLTLGVVALSDRHYPAKPTAEQLTVFRPVLLACQAEMRVEHPHDAALKVDLGEVGTSRHFMRADQQRWEIDGVLNLRGEQTFFDCTAVGSNSTLTVISATSPFWSTDPPF